MDTISIPAAVLAFLLSIGCDPTREVYRVDEIHLTPTRTVQGIYCVFVEGDYCPKANAVFISRKVMDENAVLVHELYHSCQTPAPMNSYEAMMNERQAQWVTRTWKGGE